MPRLSDYPSLRIGILLLLLLCNYAAAQSALFWMDRNLVATHRASDVQTSLQTLFAGPTQRQAAQGWSTSIPRATRLLAVRPRGDELVLVLEGAAKGGVKAGRDAHVRTVHAPKDGDATILAEARRAAKKGRSVTVVTADRALAANVTGAGARVVGPSWLLDRL